MKKLAELDDLQKEFQDSEGKRLINTFNYLGKIYGQEKWKKDLTWSNGVINLWKKLVKEVSIERVDQIIKELRQNITPYTLIHP